MHSGAVKDIGFASAASPLPLVFSAYNGIETYATGFNVTVTYKNDTIINQELTSEKYGKMYGPYNRKNVYGAIFSHGPFFDRDNLVKIRQGILHYAICNPGTLIRDFQMSGNISNMHVDVLYRSQDNKKIGELNINCL